MVDLIRKDANANGGGELTDETQTIVGNKTFTGTVSATSVNNGLKQAFSVTSSTYDWAFGGTGGSNNSDRWQALVMLKVHSDATNASQYLISIQCYGAAGINVVFLSSSNPGGANALTITRLDANTIRFAGNGYQVVKRLHVIYQV